MNAFLRLSPVIVCSVLGCTSPDEGQSRTWTSFDVVIGASGDPDSLPSDHEAVISLSAAQLSLGTLEWFEGEPLFAFVPPLLDRVLSFSTARAHPGHYTSGEALADLVSVGVVDLLAGPTVVGTAEALTGAYGTLSLTYADTAELGGASVFLSGTATVTQAGGERVVPFSLALPLNRGIEGVPAVMEVSGSEGTVTLTVSLQDLVRRIDFSQIPAATSDLMTIEQARNSVERSVQSQATYDLSYAEGPSR